MRKKFLSSLAAVLASAGLAVAETPPAAALELPQQPALIAPHEVALAPPEAAGPPANEKDPPKADKAELIAAPKTAVPPAGAAPKIMEYMPMQTGRIYAGAEYLLWSTKAERLPPLATTGPNVTLTGEAAAGVLGQDGTVTLFGEQAVLSSMRAGGRFTAGYWLDDSQTAAIEVSGFLLASKGGAFSATSTNGNILARPFIDPNISPSPLQSETSLLLGSSTQIGSFYTSFHNELWGAEANARWNVRNGSWYRADMLAGLRYAQVKDSLLITDNTAALPGFFVPVEGRPLVAQSSSNLDFFQTRNDFYGAQVGGHVELKSSSWFLDITGKLALGVTHQHLDVLGQTTATNTIGTGGTAGTTVFPGGLLAQPGQNIGAHSRNEFGVVPELGLVAGYELGSHARIFAGYDILYFRTNVIRPGTQIDRVVVVPGSIAKPPAFSFHDQDFWAQGLTAGFEVTF